MCSGAAVHARQHWVMKQTHRFQLVSVLGSNLINERRNHAAGAAPWCPKVDQHRHWALEHQLVKRGVRDHTSS